jgi:hypothetical protein
MGPAKRRSPNIALSARSAPLVAEPPFSCSVRSVSPRGRETLTSTRWVFNEAVSKSSSEEASPLSCIGERET